MNEEPKYNPKPAMTFASVVYSGVVIAGTTLFISFVLTAFPPDAYLSRVVMVVAGLLKKLRRFQTLLLFPELTRL